MSFWSLRSSCAGRAPRRDRRLRLVLQRRQLAQPVQDLLLRLLVGEVIGELELYVGKAEEGNGTHRREVRSHSHVHLDRNGDVTLDLFRRLSRILRDDVDERWNRIRSRSAKAIIAFM